jgi:guanylate kinase
MKKSTVIMAIVLSAILIGIALWAIGLTAPVLARDLGDRVERRHDKNEDRIDERLNNKREKINERLDAKANKRRTDWEGRRNRIEGHRERKVDRIDER